MAPMKYHKHIRTRRRTAGWTIRYAALPTVSRLRSSVVISQRSTSQVLSLLHEIHSLWSSSAILAQLPGIWYVPLVTLSLTFDINSCECKFYNTRNSNIALHCTRGEFSKCNVVSCVLRDTEYCWCSSVKHTKHSAKLYTEALRFSAWLTNNEHVQASVVNLPFQTATNVIRTRHFCDLEPWQNVMTSFLTYLLDQFKPRLSWVVTFACDIREDARLRLLGRDRPHLADYTYYQRITVSATEALHLTSDDNSLHVDITRHRHTGHAMKKTRIKSK